MGLKQKGIENSGGEISKYVELGVQSADGQSERKKRKGKRDIIMRKEAITHLRCNCASVPCIINVTTSCQ